MRMRFVFFAAALSLAAALAAYADRSASIGQLGDNAGETGKRSSASLGQIGLRAAESGGLVDQIDPEAAAGRHDIDESNVGKVLPAELDGDCALSPNQEAILDYLKAEGRVFKTNCEVLAWLDDSHLDKPSERDLFNVIFGSEAERRKQAELQRLEEERALAEAKARMLEEAMNNAQEE